MIADHATTIDQARAATDQVGVVPTAPKSVTSPLSTIKALQSFVKIA